MFIGAILRRYRERSLGQSLVEFALMLPVFLLVLAAAVDLGRLAYARVTIANVAREASFQAAQTPTSYQAGQPCSSGNPDANLVICRAILESTGSVITVTPSDIVMTCNPSCAEEMGNTVTVTASARFNLLTPVMAVFFGGTSITFSSTATNQISALPPMPTLPPGASTPEPTATPTNTPAPTATPAPTPNLGCSTVSAGFTYTSIPSTNRSPVTVSVTDTTTYNSSCTTVWAWSWGDGVTSYGKVQPPHAYYNAGPGNKHYILSLTVTSGTFTSTTGGYSILVKP
jgi:Flp pilus assembly protein TadG